MRFLIVLAALIVLLGFPVLTLSAQEAEPAADEPAATETENEPSSDEADNPEEETEETEETEEKNDFLMFGPEGRKKQFLPMPLLIQNPSLGIGGGLALTLMFKTDYSDEDSPYSAVVVPGFYTNTHSWMIGSFASLHFLEDRLRIVTGGGYIQVNSDFEYDAGTLTQNISLGVGILRGSYAVIPHLYLGGAYFFSLLKYRDFIWEGTPIDVDNVFSSGVYLTAEWDNRDSLYNPTRGFGSSLELGYFPTWLGSGSTYMSLDYDFNGYQTIVDPLILAYRAYGAHAFLDAPYSSLPTLGNGPDLRGYEAGQYRGDNLIAVQAELRWNFLWQLYLTGFGGIGTFYGTRTTLPGVPTWDGVAFPTGGFGIALLTSKETDIIIRFDFAWGYGGEFAWYFEMGNSF